MLRERGCASEAARAAQKTRAWWAGVFKLMLRTGQSYGKYMRDPQAYDKLHQNMHEKIKHATFR